MGGLEAFVVSRWYINCCSAKGKEFLLKEKKGAIKQESCRQLEEGGDPRNSKTSWGGLTTDEYTERYMKRQVRGETVEPDKRNREREKK